MAIQSMTGFARSQGTSSPASDMTFDWIWELRSVNGKGLDVRLRLPHGHEALEGPAKKVFGKHLVRGNIQAALTLNNQQTSAVPVVNEEALAAVVAAAKQLKSEIPDAQITIDGLLSVRGVMEHHEAALDEVASTKLTSDLLDGLQTAVSELANARALEGKTVAALLADQVEEIRRLTDEVKNNEARTPKAIQERLAEQVKRLTATNGNFDTDRLHQEAVVLATKADLAEEIDRLETHVVAARDLLTGDGPVGRKLDFLAQEFNRECNTICSKSNAAEITKLGLEMKVVIDQFREQTQNLE